MKKSPGIFYNTRFVVPSAHRKGKKYSSGFLDYQDRDEAIKRLEHEQYSLFMDYQDNSEKAKGLIGMHGHYLTEEERNAYVEKYNLAQSRGSVFWQDLFSFDNSWLEEHGLYDSRSKDFDELKLAGAVISTMKLIIDKENYQQPIFALAFHRNTDNIHCHVSLQELKPSREIKKFDTGIKDSKGFSIIEEQPVGFRKPSTIKAAESHFANKLLNFEEPLTRITDLIRKSLVAGVKEKTIYVDATFEQAVFDVYNALPPQRSRWFYGYAMGQHFKEPLDKLIRLHLSQFPEEIKELNELLTHLDAEYQRAYRTTEDTKFTDHNPIFKNADRTGIQNQTLSVQKFKEGKIKDLYSRVGNALLREIKAFDREMRKKGIEDPKELFYRKKVYQGSHKSDTEHEYDRKGNINADRKQGKQQGTGANKANSQSATGNNYSNQFENTLKQQRVTRYKDQIPYNPKDAKNRYETNRLLRRMDRAFKKDFKSWRNEQAYERLQQEIEYKSGREY